MSTQTKRQRSLAVLSVLILMGMLLGGCVQSAVSVDYSKPENWAYLPIESDRIKACDVFFVAPTVYLGTAEVHSMDLTDETTKAQFLGATTMEK
jgi:hypothetical protein